MSATPGARPDGAGSGTAARLRERGASLARPRRTLGSAGSRAWVALFFVAMAAPPAAVMAQDGPPVLRGRVLVGDTALSDGTVVLHEISEESQGEIDSVAVADDGSFRFTLPSTPSAAADRFYFASVRHSGILYFGDAVSRASQLDSIYEIQAYDTTIVPPGGAEIPIQGRNVFFEPNGETWRVTDIFQLRNDTDHTLVAPEGGVVWRYPLLPGARDFTSGQGEFTFEGTILENDTVSVRAAIGPGERIMVFRYTVDDPFGEIPTPGTIEALDVLVREPAPRVAVEGLDPAGPVELEQGSTYRRYTGTDVGPERVRVVEGDGAGELPVEWITVIIALALAAAAIMVVTRRPSAGPAPAAGRAGSVRTREQLLLEVARLDEAFEAEDAPTEEERAAYRARRAALLEELRSRTSGAREASRDLQHTRQG